MADMVEVMFACAADDSQASCAAWDFRTGTNMMTYKGGGTIQPQSLNIIRAEYLIAANSTKPLLHVWPINAQEQMSSVRFVVPGRVSALAVSSDCYYLVAGIQETIYIWHLTTGRMLNTISKHYQQINVIRFTDDGSFFATAGKDGGVLLWNLTQVVCPSDDSQTPLYSFTDHGLPVTDLHIGAGGIRAYMFTASLDRTCKIYDLNGGVLLLSVVFAEGLTCVTANAMETCVYVGTNEGNIYEFHIDSIPRTKEYHMEEDHTNKLQGHKEGTTVNCVKLSLDGQTLVSSGQDQQVCIWHIGSRQLLKTLSYKGAVSNLILRLTNPNIFHPEQRQPHIFGGNLRRMMDPPGADEDMVIEVLVTEQTTSDDLQPEEKRTTAAPAPSTGPKDDAKEEIEKLKAEVDRLKQINKKLFEASVKQVLETKK